jgi:hypothetical protein
MDRGIVSDVDDSKVKASDAVAENPTTQVDREIVNALIAESRIPTSNASRDVTKGVAAPTPTTPAYFTEGELLPWKGRWFRVRLLTLQDGQKVIGLDQVKATAASEKRAARELQWHRQHPRAVASRPGSRLPFTSRVSQPASV